METLFIVASPLQCLNAFEASKYLKASKVDILMLLDGNPTNKKQMERVIDELRMHANIRHINVPKDPNIISRLFFLRSLKPKSPKNYDYIILGHFRSIYQAVIANSNRGQLIYVDDGTRTVDDIKFLDIKGFDSIGYRLKSIIYRVFSVRPFPLGKSHTFFTYYASKVSTNNHIRILKNNFEALKKSISKKEITRSSKVAFIGQSLVDSNLISLENYLELIEGIDNYYSNKYGETKRLEYYVHRNESSHIEELIRNRFGWQIKRNELPLELHFISSGEIPQEIGFFFTSAAETLSHIFDEGLQLRSFYIPEHMLMGRKVEIENLYGINDQAPSIQLVKDYYNSEE